MDWRDRSEGLWQAYKFLKSCRWWVPGHMEEDAVKELLKREAGWKGAVGSLSGGFGAFLGMDWGSDPSKGGIFSRAAGGMKPTRISNKPCPSLHTELPLGGDAPKVTRNVLTRTNKMVVVNVAWHSDSGSKPDGTFRHAITRIGLIHKCIHCRLNGKQARTGQRRKPARTHKELVKLSSLLRIFAMLQSRSEQSFSIFSRCPQHVVLWPVTHRKDAAVMRHCIYFKLGCLVATTQPNPTFCCMSLQVQRPPEKSSSRNGPGIGSTASEETSEKQQNRVAISGKLPATLSAAKKSQPAGPQLQHRWPLHEVRIC